jgi:toxin HigB-1
VIRSFATSDTERIWNCLRSRKLPHDIHKRGLLKLLMIDAATEIEDLRFPPSNGLHDLKDDRLGQHAISINKQYRICFVWKDGDAHDVEIVDYH